MKSQTIRTGNDGLFSFTFDNKTRIVGHFDSAFRRAMMRYDFLSSGEAYLREKGGQHVTELY